MEFIPYSCQNITRADIEAVNKVLVSEFLTQGPTIAAFESAFAEAHETAHAVAVSNATAGLHLALLALDVGPQSRVWTCPNSFVASANAARYCGAQVDFVDIDHSSRNMSIGQLQKKLELAKNSRQLPDVLIPVDFSGLSADLREMRVLGDQYGFKIVEDASHAAGASYLGKRTGSRFADITVFSFHAVKIITTAEGGMVLSNDGALAQRVRQLRSHGITRVAAEMKQTSEGPWYYEQVSLGFNYRMTDLQAALGLSQLARLEELLAQRCALVDRYSSSLAGLPLLLPGQMDDRQSSWHLYVIEIDGARTGITRRDVFAHLRRASIGVNVHYIPIHTQPYYRNLGFDWGDFPASEQYYRRAISIPLFPAMTRAQQDRVVAELKRALHA
jgi:UDP-4-amino-4,6-dideoxy-N-acetyl-beta-L-altrosamine transaminase